jgi:hypothetical protein
MIKSCSTGIGGWREVSLICARPLIQSTKTQDRWSARVGRGLGGSRPSRSYYKIALAVSYTTKEKIYHSFGMHQRRWRE